MRSSGKHLHPPPPSQWRKFEVTPRHKYTLPSGRQKFPPYGGAFSKITHIDPYPVNV